GPFEIGLEGGDLAVGMKPGVECDPASLREGRAEPVGELLLRVTADLEGRALHLGLDLEPVAAVDEDHGAISGHGGETRRSGEAGEPGEPLVAGGDVLALMGVGAGDEEGIDTGRRHRLTQRGETGRDGRGRGRASYGGGSPGTWAGPREGRWRMVSTD